MSSRIHHLYLHLPFCPSICPYCSFHVQRVDRPAMEKFSRELRRDFETAVALTGPLNRVETIFYGGGTPTVFSTAQLEAIGGIVAEFTEGSRPLEVSMEANPATLSPAKAETIRKLGVNRVSVGAQSFDAEVLRTLGRRHSVPSIEEAWTILRNAGFENLNLDLIFGVPGQSLESWKRTLEAALALRPEHLSCYGLTYEEDTPFFERHRRGELVANEPRETEMFEVAEETLEAAGFRHYEISNYARPGRECRHNQAYWNGADYLGVGPSAVSTFGGKRRRMMEGVWAEIEDVDDRIRAKERLLLGLRTDEGADARGIEGELLEALLAAGFAELAGPKVRLTRAGRLRADAIATYLC
ncbi:MAG: radical SAM family heme chaperone HemW [Verrucomicrobiae bacterium]|nr:radical SAM family heme chaperone HemW [Verrucomicrobiae bacterium]